MHDVIATTAWKHNDIDYRYINGSCADFSSFFFFFWSRTLRKQNRRENKTKTIVFSSSFLWAKRFWATVEVVTNRTHHRDHRCFWRQTVLIFQFCDSQRIRRLHVSSRRRTRNTINAFRDLSRDRTAPCTSDSAKPQKKKKKKNQAENAPFSGT